MNKATKRVRELMFSRIAIVAVLLALQMGILLLFILRLSRYFAAMYGVFMLLSVVVVLYLVNKEDNPSYKLAWVVPILVFPLFGGLFYLMFGNTRLGRKHNNRMKDIRDKANIHYAEDPQVADRLQQDAPEPYAQSRYIARMGYPLYEGTATRYLSPGEDKFVAMLEALNGAKRYILLEYFIIEEGKMWNAILEILARKAAEGVEVRVMYDGFGCLTTLPNGYYKKLREMGIQCIEFNPLVPVLSMMMNNRDHRKILVIDGHTGFMGGINLADEYINAVNKHGHWKDCAVELRGPAVWSLIMMFLTMWEGITGSIEEYDNYRPLSEELPIGLENGFVQPYSDSPLDDELVGEMVYLNMINRARDYIYICSPYIIIDNETVTALTLAAKSGVDVRIMTPHHGDKWFVHMTTRAYYHQLVRGGVKIYEYTPGFVHSKSFVCDDEVAVVGTINLDYRSLYLHFECGLWMCHTDAVSSIKQDFLTTLECCTPISLDSPMIKVGAIQRITRAVLRLFAPLM